MLSASSFVDMVQSVCGLLCVVCRWFCGRGSICVWSAVCGLQVVSWMCFSLCVVCCVCCAGGFVDVVQSVCGLLCAVCRWFCGGGSATRGSRCRCAQ